MKFGHILFLGFSIIALEAWSQAPQDSPVEAPTRLPVMTWYHPVLRPGIAPMTLLCTVTKATQDREVYGNPYWTVELRIDEKIFVAKNYEKRLAKVSRLESGDFRKRKVGERIVVFVGGEPYDGDDFLLPCWKGTATDLGILLKSKKNDDGENESLLAQLRNPTMDSEFFEAFAAFCPQGVAEYFIQKLRRSEMEPEVAPAK